MLRIKSRLHTMTHNILHTSYLHIYLILSSRPLPLLSTLKPHWLSFCSLNVLSLFLSLYLCTYCLFLLELSYLDFSHCFQSDLDFSLISPSQRTLAWFAHANHGFTLHPPTVKGPVCVTHCLAWCLVSNYYSVNIVWLIQ